MIRITRTQLPYDVAAHLSRLTAEIHSTPHDERRPKARTLWDRSGAHVREPVRSTLASMAAGIEQCMYCGEGPGIDVDHFEPLSRNPLRTFDWLNHLLACGSCNKRKHAKFPVDGDGNPLLLDPTVDDPSDHLQLVLAAGRYRALTTRGSSTCDALGLNRRTLEMGRVRARETIGHLLAAWHVAFLDQDAVRMAKVEINVRLQPFADVCQTMLRLAVHPQAEVIFSDKPDELELLRMPDLRAALLTV